MHWRSQGQMGRAPGAYQELFQCIFLVSITNLCNLVWLFFLVLYFFSWGVFFSILNNSKQTANLDASHSISSLLLELWHTNRNWNDSNLSAMTTVYFLGRQGVFLYKLLSCLLRCTAFLAHVRVLQIIM